MKKSRNICVGVITGAHGVRGQLRLRSFTDNPEDIFSYKPLTDESGEKIFRLKHVGEGKDFFTASSSDVKDRDAAEALKGTKLYVERSALPRLKKTEYYGVDLIGLEAQTEKGEKIGKVLSLHDYGAGAFLEIKPAKGSSFMLPFKNEFVPDVDLKEGTITAIIPDGWIEEEKKK